MKIAIALCHDGIEVAAKATGPDGETVELKTIVNAPLETTQASAFTEAINTVIAGVENTLDELGFSREERAISTFISTAVLTDDGAQRPITVEGLEAMIPEVIQAARHPVGAPTSASEPATQLEPNETLSVAGSE